MRKFILSASCVAFIALCYSCKNKSSETTNTSAEIKVINEHFSKSEGTDCDKPDSLRMDCATIDISWPSVEGENKALQQSVNTWVTDLLTTSLIDNAEDTSKTTLEKASKIFFKNHQEMVKNEPKSARGFWSVTTKDSILFNNGKLLTLEISGYSFQAGAHGNQLETLATFDINTGKKLTWDDVVTDKIALQKLAEEKFKVARPELFKPTEGLEPYKFDETFPFKLPYNFGVTLEGIYFNYVPYEVTPYYMGSTTFILSYADIKTILKIKK